MQTNSGTTSTRKTSVKSKSTKRPKAEAPSETLHLKAKQLVATPLATDTIDIDSMIATAAYFRAVQRGFEPGHELEDWLHAEQQLRSRFAS
jgi:Protein of unknown function (DUF2934)